MNRRFATDDNFDFSDATEAYADGVDAYEGSLTFDIDNPDSCIRDASCQFNIIDVPISPEDGITPLCIHCFRRMGA